MNNNDELFTQKELNSFRKYISRKELIQRRAIILFFCVMSFVFFAWQLFDAAKLASLIDLCLIQLWSIDIRQDELYKGIVYQGKKEIWVGYFFLYNGLFLLFISIFLESINIKNFTKIVKLHDQNMNIMSNSKESCR